MSDGENEASKKKVARAAGSTNGAERKSVRLALPKGGTDVRAVRKKIGLTRDKFARMTGFSVRTIAAWEGGSALRGAAQRMAEMSRLQDALSRVMKHDFIATWLATPNEGFGGLKPLEVIERGELDRIWRMIYLLESGTPS